MADISAIKLPDGNIYNVKDSEAVTEINGISPITSVANGDGSYDIEHDVSGVTAGTYTGGLSKTTLYLPSITVDEQGHVTMASNNGESISTISRSNYYGLMSSSLYQSCIKTPYNFLPGVSDYSYGAKYLTAGNTTGSWTISDPTGFLYDTAINVYNVVARDSITGEQVLVDWSTTITGYTKSCELTVSIAEAYENDIIIVPFFGYYLYGH